MANYNYNGYPYGNFYQPYMPQPNYSNSGNQTQTQLNQYAFVNGIEGAKSFQLLPNQTIMLMDSENPICYMKSSNSMGQSTLKYFKLTEISEQDVRNQNSGQPAVDQHLQEYALKSDLEALSRKIDEISSRFEKPEKEDK